MCKPSRMKNLHPALPNSKWNEEFSVQIQGEGDGAGDRDRTGDIQLGKLTFCH